MASECAVLGVPAIYAATTGRGYTDEQEARYGLVSNTSQLQWQSVRSVVDAMLQVPREEWPLRRARLLADTIDVAAYVADVIENGAGKPA